MHTYSAALLLLAGGALATQQQECFANHAKPLAEFTDCGNRESLAGCLFKLKGVEREVVEACYVAAGCSESEAAEEARYAQDRCRDLVEDDSDLRKRYHAIYERADSTAASDSSSATEIDGNHRKGTICFTTHSSKTTNCVISTIDGKATRLPCSDIEVTSSKCAPDWLCTTDATGDDICTKAKGIDTGGIIVALVLGSATALGFAFLTFLCCKESRQHKKAAAQAEAKALARAATQKKRAQEVRQPLMRQQDGGADPFHDQNRA